MRRNPPDAFVTKPRGEEMKGSRRTATSTRPRARSDSSFWDMAASSSIAVVRFWDSIVASERQ